MTNADSLPFFSPSPVSLSLQNVNANPRPTAQDLAGFWDLLQLSIEDISLKFDELYHLKANDWKVDRDSPDKQVHISCISCMASVAVC